MVVITRFSIQYGTGAASNFSTSVDNPNPYDNNSARFLLTEQVVFQPNDKFAIMPIFVYQKNKDGNPQHPWTQWESIGARPEIFFTNHVSLAVEGGFDHTSNPGQYEGWVRKVTIAPQIGVGRKFFSRPVLRAFVTYAELVGRFPWSRGRSAIREQNKRADVRGTDRNVVVVVGLPETNPCSIHVEHDKSIAYTAALENCEVS